MTVPGDAQRGLLARTPARETSELFWRVEGNGYEWLRALVPLGKGAHSLAEQQVLLVPRCDAGPIRRTQYAPLIDHPALFRTFADVPLTEEGTLAFADRFGELGVTRYTIKEYVSPRPELPPVKKGSSLDARQPGDVRGDEAENFDSWMAALVEIKQATELLDLVKQGDRQGLARRILWAQRAEGLAVYYVPEKLAGVPGKLSHLTRERWIAAPTYLPEWFAHFPEGDTLYPAVTYLYRVVNEKLAEMVSAGLYHDIRSWQASIRLLPRTLLGCLWLQLAETVTGQREQRKCLGCGEWFQVGVPGSRADKQFCSQACRNRVYRERIERARQLKAEGKTIKQIAKELSVEEASVKKWVTSKKGD